MGKGEFSPSGINVHTDLTETQLPDLTGDLPRMQSVSFDADRIRLEGRYTDQLSAYRARRIWRETLLNYFLLEPEHDFTLQVASDKETSIYTLNCDFTSACARYCFWRLTNDQTPEAQYLIETAHIPQAASQREEFLFASDLKPLHQEDQAVLSRIAELSEAISKGPLQRLLDVLKKLYR